MNASPPHLLEDTSVSDDSWVFLGGVKRNYPEFMLNVKNLISSCAVLVVNTTTMASLKREGAYYGYVWRCTVYTSLHKLVRRPMPVSFEAHAFVCYTTLNSPSKSGQFWGCLRPIHTKLTRNYPKSVCVSGAHHPANTSVAAPVKVDFSQWTGE